MNHMKENDPRFGPLDDTMRAAGFSRRVYGWNRKDSEMLIKVVVDKSPYSSAIYLDLQMVILALLRDEIPSRAKPQISGRLDQCVDGTKNLRAGLSGEGSPDGTFRQVLDEQVRPFLAELSLESLAAADPDELRRGLLFRPEARLFLEGLRP